jgi:signal peptidase
MLIGRNTTQLLLTKGDNNKLDDFMLYNGIEWLERKHVIGKVKGYVVFPSPHCTMFIS